MLVNFLKIGKNSDKKTKQIMYCKREHFEIFTPWYKNV